MFSVPKEQSRKSDQQEEAEQAKSSALVESRLAQIHADVAQLALEGDMPMEGLSEETQAQMKAASPVVLAVNAEEPSSAACIVHDDQMETVMLDTGAEVGGVCNPSYYQRKLQSGDVLKTEVENLAIQSAAKDGGSLQYQKTAIIRLVFVGKPRTVNFKVCKNFGTRPLIGNPEFKSRGEDLCHSDCKWRMKSDDGREVEVPFCGTGESNRHGR